MKKTSVIEKKVLGTLGHRVHKQKFHDEYYAPLS